MAGHDDRDEGFRDRDKDPDRYRDRDRDDYDDRDRDDYDDVRRRDDPRALEQIKGPAIGLLVTAILGIVGHIISIPASIYLTAWNEEQMRKLGGNPNQQFAQLNMVSGTFGIVVDIVGIITGVVVLIGALKMQKLESFAFAMTISILSMIPYLSPCCCTGLPFGIWALVVLNKPEVKDAFR